MTFLRYMWLATHISDTFIAPSELIYNFELTAMFKTPYLQGEIASNLFHTHPFIEANFLGKRAI